MSEEALQFTQLLHEWNGGKKEAIDQLMPVIYDELRKLARRYLYSERRDHTLRATALVNEAYVRLVHSDATYQDRVHFYAVAANTMRRVLIDQARKRKSLKRGQGVRVTLQTGMDVARERGPDVVALDEALQRLAGLDARKGRVIELKFFGGMTSEEIGQVLGISVATVGRELRLGQAWLRREMSRT